MNFSQKLSSRFQERESKGTHRFVNLFSPFFFAIIFLFTIHSSAYAASYYWVGGTTNSNTSNPANWSSAGPCADSANLNVPGPTDAVYFVSSCINDAIVDSTLSVDYFRMDNGYSGTVTLDNTAMTVDAQLTVDGGNLNITNGGSVAVSSGSQIIIGNLAAADGTITVDGTGSQLTNSNARIRVGNSGIGHLIIQNGGSASTGQNYSAYMPGSFGYITVDGADSIWNSDMQGGLGFIGRQGTTTLIISNGGIVNSAASPWQVGGQAGSTGTIDISGEGSELNMTGDDCNFRVGYSGTGTLTVRDGAVMNVTGNNGRITVADQIGSNGTLNIGENYTIDVITATSITAGAGTSALPPDPPTSLTRTSALQGYITWDWNDVTGATGYKVYNASNDTLLSTITSATSSWTQGSLSPSTSYSVYVRSTNAQGTGAASSHAPSTTLCKHKFKEDKRCLATTPPAPQWALEYSAKDGVNLLWSAIDGSLVDIEITNDKGEYEYKYLKVPNTGHMFLPNVSLSQMVRIRVLNECKYGDWLTVPNNP